MDRSDRANKANRCTVAKLDQLCTIAITVLGKPRSHTTGINSSSSSSRSFGGTARQRDWNGWHCQRINGSSTIFICGYSVTAILVLLHIRGSGNSLAPSNESAGGPAWRKSNSIECSDARVTTCRCWWLARIHERIIALAHRGSVFSSTTPRGRQESSNVARGLANTRHRLPVFRGSNDTATNRNSPHCAGTERWRFRQQRYVGKTRTLGKTEPNPKRMIWQWLTNALPCGSNNMTVWLLDHDSLRRT
mmetsp:Transcript_5894/g.17629  ORF Transcript_5894/g.17629 Transcript_5894/m.17629 type:complete len:248 (-) Transcript_5894:151-894(-)